ncbi:o-succinylbenzoate--CoA ligase [Halobacillus sp. Marseille-Q1614]|uniref:o-succinylbenzoate--CoA ligase n=1 Tax=Halobacillus sp. Marseille-Q1614 TaxID=2709134 RepID=UPI0015711957|nr:o-succinylbenzoate--CoA ligase [Halobacillus sp. Marseille-Q1614]
MEIPHWLEKQADLQPGRPAIELEDGSVLTFLELRNQSRKTAYGLIECGVKKGDHIAILAANHVQYAVLVHAVSYIGAVAVCLNTRLTVNDLMFQVNDADVSHLAADHDQMEKANQIKDGIQDPLTLYSLEDMPQSDKTYPLHEFLKLDDVFTMMFTSGTTGRPKAVMHTYGNHWFSAIGSSLNLGLHSNDKWLVCLPVFHVGGFSLIMKNMIYGMPIVLLKGFDQEKVIDQILNKGVTLISIVTVMLQRLLSSNLKEFPPHFRGALLGGGPVPVPLLEEAKERRLPVFQSFGMTETSSQISTLSPDDAFRKIGSAGKALGTASLKIMTKGREVPADQVGEIFVKGPMVTRGYYNHPLVSSDYLATGDLGYLDDDGFLYVVDRVKDMIISGGENIYPAEIESVLQGMTQVLEVAVTGLPHEKWGEAPAAFIVLKPGVSLTSKEVLDFCKDKLASYKFPRAVYFIDELPRNASNKLVRRKLPEYIQERD